MSDESLKVKFWDNYIEYKVLIFAVIATKNVLSRAKHKLCQPVIHSGKWRV